MFSRPAVVKREGSTAATDSGFFLGGLKVWVEAFPASFVNELGLWSLLILRRASPSLEAVFN